MLGWVKRQLFDSTAVNGDLWEDFLLIGLCAGDAIKGRPIGLSDSSETVIKGTACGVYKRVKRRDDNKG